MFLQPDPGPRPPGFDQLARSVELKRQQLERDIAEYIEQRRHELRAYEDEVGGFHMCMTEIILTPTAVSAAPLHGMR